MSCLIFQLPTIAIYRLRLLITLPLSLRSLLTTAAIVEIADLGTVELLLLQPLVDLVVDEAGPAGGRVARADLRRVLGQQLLEVARAVAARVQSREQLDVRLERERILLRRLLGEPRHHRVEELPGRATELGPVNALKSELLAIELSVSEHMSLARTLFLSRATGSLGDRGRYRGLRSVSRGTTKSRTRVARHSEERKCEARRGKAKGR